MASLTRSQLKTSSNSTYDTNGVGGITAAEVRTFNDDLIDSLVTNDLTSSMIVLSASFASTASSVLPQVLTSLNAYTASNDQKWSTLQSYTQSNDTTNTAQNNRLSNLETTSASVNISVANLNQSSASQQVSINALNSATASYVTETESGSFLITASFNNGTRNLTFTKGDTTTFAVNIPDVSGSAGEFVTTSSFNAYTSSNDEKVNSLIAATGSYATTGSNSFNGNQIITGSFTINNGGGNQLSIPSGTPPVVFKVDTPIQINGIFGGSGVGFSLLGTNPRLFFQDTDTSYSTQIYNSANDFYIGQNNGKFISFPSASIPTTTIYNKLNVSGSVSITGSLTASLQEGYAWVGNSNGVSIAVATSSFVGTTTNITALNQFTASQETKNSTLASYTGSNDTKWNTLGALSGSFITESETASFARTNVDNNFTANQTFTNISAVSASFQYVQTLFETASVIYSSGSNQLGDELTDTQTLSGSVKVQGSLTINGVPVQTSSVDITALNQFTASQETKNSTLAIYTASVDSSLSNINSFTASNGNTSLNSYTQSNDTKWSNLAGQTGSYVTAAITGSSLVTASVNLNTITFTKGDASTFNITVNTGSGGGATDITSLNQFTASQETKNTTLQSVTSSLNSATQSLFVSASLAIVTASISNDDITFTKGDGSQFTIQVATGSFAETASLAINALDIIVNVKNTTGAQIDKGTVVRIIGATGDNPLIGTASWENDASSANTLGFVVTDIPNDAFGRVMTQGTLLSVNTDPALGYAAGQLVYLSSSGQFTNQIPPAPYHEVRLGQVLRAQQNNGSIYVLVQNGYELSELHDVDINTGSLATNNLLAYNSASGQWENKTLTQVGATTTSSFNAYTGSNDTKWNTLGGLTGSFATTGSNTFIGTEIISGALFVFDSGSGAKAEIMNGQISRFPQLYTSQLFPQNIYSDNGVNISFDLPAGGGTNGGTFKVNAVSGSQFTGSIGVSGSVDITGQFLINGVPISGSNLSEFTTTSSFNSYTSSNNQRVSSLEAATGSYATTGSNAFSGSNTFNGNFSIITSPDVNNIIISASADNNNDRKILSVLNNSDLFPNSGSNLSYDGIAIGARTGSNASAAVAEFAVDYNNGPSLFWTPNRGDSANTNRIRFTNLNNVTQSVQIQTGLFQLYNNGSRNIADIGKVISFPIVPGTNGQYLRLIDANGTIGFSGIESGSFATTGSNTFTGIQTFQDAGLNATSLVSTSGSLMLVAKSFTSASAHLSSSANSFVNLIFKNNNNTADTIISGSNNIFVNAAAPTAGFKRYFGGSGNIMLNASNVPQISGSMAFSPTMNNNYFGGNSTTLTMRAPVSASTYTISGNSILGTVNIGSSATLHAEKLTAAFSMTGNQIAGTVNVIANQTALTGSTTQLNNNIVIGTITLNLSSSAILLANNIFNDSGFIFTNQFVSSSAGLSTVGVNRNNIGGQSNQFIISGSLPAGTTTANSLSDNFIFGGSNTLYVDVTNSRVSGSNAYINAIRTGLMGNALNVSGSSLLTDASSYGSVFVGRYNADDARRNKTSDVVFVVGTGNTSARKTGLLIDSGSNTFVEGSLNVSGSSTFTGSVNITGSLTITGSATIGNVLELSQLNPLPTGADGQLAVSASNLYFFSGSAWNRVSLV